MALWPPLMASVQRNREREKGNIEAGKDNATWGGKGGQKVGVERGGEFVQKGTEEWGMRG